MPSERKGADVEREIRRELMPKWEAKPIGEISDTDVFTIIKAKKRKGAVAARNLFALVKRFFRWVAASPEYDLKVSPCANLSATSILGEMKGARVRALSDEELFAFWRATSRMAYPAGPAYRLLLLTALRLREATNAKWSEFDLRKREWTIPAERMKGKNAGKKQARAHVVPLTDEMLSILAALPKFNGHQFLFSTTGGRVPFWPGAKVKDELDRRMLSTLRALARMRGEDPKRVELEHFVNHDLRRTVRSHLSRLRIPEEAREAVLAHARPGIKATYDKYDYLDEKREALELWAARLQTIVEPAPPNVVRITSMA